MDPIKPRYILDVLKSANHNSSPGPDGLPYGIIFHLSCTDHTLAKLFNKVLETSAVPSAWEERILKLIHKKEVQKKLEINCTVQLHCKNLSFHPRKTHHHILHKNKLIVPAVQKAFLPGISGCTEQNAVTKKIIKKTSRTQEKPVTYNF